MLFFIYETKNLIDGKTYIGCHKTENIEDDYLGSGKLLKRAIKKHGRQFFQRSILEFCSSEAEMYEREKIYVNESYVSSPNTYNLRCGGYGGRMIDEIRIQVSQKLKRPKTQETKRKMSEAQIGKKHTAETKQKILEAIQNRPPISEKTRFLLSQRAKQRPCNAKNSKWITNGINNKRISFDQPIPEGFWCGRTY
jgi:group I intron endonuclease